MSEFTTTSDAADHHVTEIFFVDISRTACPWQHLADWIVKAGIVLFRLDVLLENIAHSAKSCQVLFDVLNSWFIDFFIEQWPKHVNDIEYFDFLVLYAERNCLLKEFHDEAYKIELQVQCISMSLRLLGQIVFHEHNKTNDAADNVLIKLCRQTLQLVVDVHEESIHQQ